MTHEITGNHGSHEVDSNGTILRSFDADGFDLPRGAYFDAMDGDDGMRIYGFDMQEAREYFAARGSDLPLYLDILDVGYVWTNGYKMAGYEPAIRCECMDFETACGLRGEHCSTRLSPKGA